MSQTIITLAFEQWKAREAAEGTPVVLDEFVFAQVPGLEPAAPIDRNETLPAAEYIVHRQAVNKTGVVNQHAVVYSVTLGTDVGDFDFNWVGLANRASGTLALIVHAPVQRKLVTANGQQGNAITRSFLMAYTGAAVETGITTPAESWQIDFTARLSGLDERQRRINLDHYGVAAFFGDGFRVTRSGQRYAVTAGTGYIRGLRAELTKSQPLTLKATPTQIWVDVSLQGNVVSRWETVITFSLGEAKTDYVDESGFAHYVFALARIDEDGTVTDLRPSGSLLEQATNSAYLRKDDNLAALKDKRKSREHLGLKSAALCDVGTEAGQVMKVGAFGLGGKGITLNETSDAALMTTAKARGSSFMRNNGQGVSVPVHGAGFFSRVGDTNTLLVADYNSGKAVVLAANDKNIERPKVNVLYGTANKPSADDVGAYSKQESEGRYYPKTGGTVNGDIVVEGSQLLLKGDNRKHLGFHNQDGSIRMWLYKDKGGDGVHLNNGNDGGGDWVFNKNGHFYSPKALHAAGATYQEDGNIHGSVWGGHLSGWVENRIRGSAEFWVNGDNWWFKDNRRGLIFQGGLRIGVYADATERIGLHVHCPNRLLHVSLCVKNFAQGYSTQYNPQVRFLGDQHDGFDWCHGAREKEVYWMAIGY